MAQQTINVGTSPNDGTGTPLRTAFQYTNSNFSELYTAVGPSGNNIVVPGNATITGDLTVDTNTFYVNSSTNRVGIGLTSPNRNLSIYGATNSLIHFTTASTGPLNTDGFTLGVETDSSVTLFNSENTPFNFYVNSTLGMTLNSTGLGVGGSPTRKLSIVGSGNTYANINSGDNTSLVGVLFGGTSAPSNGQIIYNNTDNSMGLHTAGAVKLTIDSSGNVGVGVTPSAWNSDQRALQVSSSGSYVTSYISGATVNQWLFIGNNAFYDSVDSRWEYIRSKPSAQYIQYNNEHQWLRDTGTQTAGAACTFTQAMTLDASGNLLVGKTASSTTVACSQIQPDGTFSAVKGDANPGFFYNRSTAASGTIALFRSNSVTVGSITQDGTNTSYVTTSDYRLKEDVQPLVGGLARVSALKPSIYKWKSNGSNGEGFLAHELAEVVPSAVIGSKDEVNEDGSIKAQGVDLSKVVPVLVAAIQELTARVQTLETR